MPRNIESVQLLVRLTCLRLQRQSCPFPVRPFPQIPYFQGFRRECEEIKRTERKLKSLERKK